VAESQEGGCQFFGWYEAPCDVFVRGLLVDLRDAVWNLKRENKNLKDALGDGGMKLEQEKKKGEALKIRVAEMQANTEATVIRMKRFERERFFLSVVCVGLLIALLFS